MYSQKIKNENHNLENDKIETMPIMEKNKKSVKTLRNMHKIDITLNMA